MEVLCKNHKICGFGLSCEHAKKHTIIHIENDQRGTANNCILHQRIDPYDGTVCECYCSSIFLRNDKLKKLNYESNL